MFCGSYLRLAELSLMQPVAISSGHISPRFPVPSTYQGFGRNDNLRCSEHIEGKTESAGKSTIAPTKDEKRMQHRHCVFPFVLLSQLQTDRGVFFE